MNSQHSNGWVDDGSSSAGREGGDDGSEDHVTEVEVALAQGIASSLRTLVIASFRAPPNKFVLGETKGDKRRRKGGGGYLVPLVGCRSTEWPVYHIQYQPNRLRQGAPWPM